MINLVNYQEMERILKTARTIAVVGLSPKPNRPSHQVAAYLLEAGYTVIPVNPGQQEILGQPCYPDLSAVPVPVDVVDIFRNPKDVPSVVDTAIAIKAGAVWMQEGITHQEAGNKAQAAGLAVVMDYCIKTAHKELSAS